MSVKQVIIDGLGVADDRVVQKGHESLSVFGIVEGEDAVLLQPVSRALQVRGSLVQTEHGGLALAGDARDILTGEAAVVMAKPPERQRGRSGRGRGGGSTPNPVGDPLFDALRNLRRDLAAEAGVPPYVVFHDAALRAMATDRPVNLAEMSQIPGVGAKKLEAYGEPFLKAIAEY